MDHVDPVQAVQVVHVPASNATMISGDAELVLIAQLRSQIEYYFSYQNLSRDTFLQSMLTSTDHLGSVPTEIIANFPKVKEIYARGIGLAPEVLRPPADVRLIYKALKGSSVVSITDDAVWIIPKNVPDFHSISLQNVLSTAPPSSATTATTLSIAGDSTMEGRGEPSSPTSQNTSVSSTGIPTHPYQHAPSKERSTVIVRNFECTEQEMMDHFTTPQIKPKSAKLVVGNVWYIHFASEQEALQAIAKTRNVLLRGMPVLARIKSEITPALTPSFQPSPSSGYASPYTYRHISAYPYPTYAIAPPMPYLHYPPEVVMTHVQSSNMELAGVQATGEPSSETTQKKKQRKHRKRSRNNKSAAAALQQPNQRPPQQQETNEQPRKHRHNERHHHDAKDRASNKQVKPRGENIKDGKNHDVDTNNKKKEDASPEIFSEDNFPTLGGKVMDKSPVFQGYAKALLKASVDQVTADLDSVKLQDGDSQ